MSRRPHVLFVTYNGILEPLGFRQGVAYLLPLLGELEVSVVSFEKARDLADVARRTRMEARLRDAGIRWQARRYRSRPPLASTVLDIASGASSLRRIHRARPVDLIHARGYPPAAMARRASRSSGVPYLFDIRGLLADEYVDGGLWREGGLAWRMTRWAEQGLLRDAAGIVTLTEAVRTEVQRRRGAAGADAQTPWEVIPCCADLDEFRPDPEARARVRRRLGFGQAPVALYAGSVGTWYPLEPMVTFLGELRRLVPDLRVLLLLNRPDGRVGAAFERAGWAPERVAVVRAAPEEVPEFMAAGDLGLCFVQPSPSKRASSPTKVAEYLATGLPVVVNRGVGDLADLASEPSVVVAGALEREALSRAARDARATLELDRDVPRELARRAFDLHGVGAAGYRRVYRRMLEAGAPASAAGSS